MVKRGKNGVQGISRKDDGREKGEKKGFSGKN